MTKMCWATLKSIMSDLLLTKEYNIIYDIYKEREKKKKLNAPNPIIKPKSANRVKFKGRNIPKSTDDKPKGNKTRIGKVISI